MTNEEAVSELKYMHDVAIGMGDSTGAASLSLAITALSAPPDPPEGWVMVPREPDAGLVLIGMNAFDEICDSGQPMDLAVAHAWRTMVGLCGRRAAPPAPETPA